MANIQPRITEASAPSAHRWEPEREACWPRKERRVANSAARRERSSKRALAAWERGRAGEAGANWSLRCLHSRLIRRSMNR